MIKDIFKEKKHLVYRSTVMPRESNPKGDMFGGWALSIIDMCVGSLAVRMSQGYVVTRSVKEVSFDHPVMIGDEISIYAELVNVGKTSMTFNVEMHSVRSDGTDVLAVHGQMIFVGIDRYGNKRDIPK